MLRIEAFDAFFLPLSASNSQLERHLGLPLFVTHAETQGRDDPGEGLPRSPSALVHSKGCGFERYKMGFKGKGEQQKFSKWPDHLKFLDKHWPIYLHCN